MQIDLTRPNTSRRKVYTNTIAKRREVLGWSQRDLARRVGVSSSTLDACERDIIIPGVTLAQRLARAVGCSVDELFILPEDTWLAKATDVSPSEPQELGLIRTTSDEDPVRNASDHSPSSAMDRIRALISHLWAAFAGSQGHGLAVSSGGSRN